MVAPIEWPPDSSPPPSPLHHRSGRQFGTSSLEIHLKACRVKYERENGKPAPELPKDHPTNKPVTSREWSEFNAAAEEGWNDSLVPCPNCGRTFLPDRLEIHLRSCRGSSGARLPPSTPPPPVAAGRSPSPRGPASKLTLPVCHICGRQFGTSSLEIHLKTCRVKYERENGKPAPELPKDIPTNKPVKSREWSEFNAAAEEGWNGSLAPCPHCGRTFLPDRLEIHLRSCRGGSSSARPPPVAPSPATSARRPLTATPPLSPKDTSSGSEGGASAEGGTARVNFCCSPTETRRGATPRRGSTGGAVGSQDRPLSETRHPDYKGRPSSQKSTPRTASPAKSGGKEGRSSSSRNGSPSRGKSASRKTPRDRMAELTELLEAQMITQDEYEAKRAQILSGI